MAQKRGKKGKKGGKNKTSVDLKWTAKAVHNQMRWWKKSQLGRKQKMWDKKKLILHDEKKSLGREAQNVRQKKNFCGSKVNG